MHSSLLCYFYLLFEKYFKYKRMRFQICYETYKKGTESII